MSKSVIRNILLAATLTITPALAGADCPNAWGQSSAPSGAWYANEDSAVTVMTLNREGNLMISVEIYDRSPLLDEMKLELSAKECKRDTSESKKTFEDGSYEIICADARIERASEGLAALFNLVTAIEDIATLVGGSSSADGTMTLRVKQESDGMRFYNEDKETGKVTSTLMEPISNKRATDYMERFRQDTIVVNRPTERSQRERDLP